MRRLILRSFQSPGDILMLTAAVRDLHAAHPGQFQTDVRTSCADLWQHNPHLTPLSERDGGVEQLEMHYPLIHESNQRPYHFIHGYPQYLEQQLGLRIPLTQFRGDIHLSDEERATPSANGLGRLPERYWILVAGGKYDFTAKWWNPKFYQQVVDHFRGRVEFLQCGEAGHWHPPLRGVTNLVGKTTPREFVRLMHHAEGVVCPVTFAMHLAAAVPTKGGRTPHRPCVVIAGGREPAHWEAYPQHQFLSTNGTLPCCLNGGCWRSRCQLVGDGDLKDCRDVCERPVQITPELRIPQCLQMITADDVIRRIELYFEGGALPGGHGAQDVDRKSVSETPRLPASSAGAPIPAVARRPLILEFPHDLAATVELSIVLKHLRHYHPDGSIHVEVPAGQERLLAELCQGSFADEHADPRLMPDRRRLAWPACDRPYPNAPSTRAARCLIEEFRLSPIEDLFRYTVSVPEVAQQAGRTFLANLCEGAEALPGGRWPVVLIDAPGLLSSGAGATFAELAAVVRGHGRVPLFLSGSERGTEAGLGPDDRFWQHAEASSEELLAALVQHTRLVVGTTRATLRLAAALSTPAIALWPVDHPAQEFDLASHVLHLLLETTPVPCSYPAEEYFRRHYHTRRCADFTQELLQAVTERLEQAPPGVSGAGLPSISTVKRPPAPKAAAAATRRVRARSPQSIVQQKDGPAFTSVKFLHGLGDCANFARLIPLYVRRGHGIGVECTPDKALLFEAAGARIVPRADHVHGWNYPPCDVPAGHSGQHLGSKLGWNLSESPLPGIGAKAELWDEYCQSRVRVSDRISASTREFIAEWLRDLPRPIVLLHTKGNTAQSIKSLPDAITARLYGELLDRFDGSLVLLDWDRRVPDLASYRVRHLDLMPGGCGTERMLALIEAADLLVGVDSGPLHAAGLTDTPRVGVWMPGHYPARYTLPDPAQLNLVLAEATSHWNRFHRVAWNIVEQRGSVFDAAWLAEQIVRMLTPPRYLDREHHAADVQLQQWVREWCRGDRQRLPVGYTDRNRSFDVLLKEATRRFRTPTIVETGTIRAEEDWAGAGFSTYLLAAYVTRRGGRLHSVDLSPQHCQFARTWCAGFGDAVQVAQGDSVEFLRRFEQPIDLLYVDSLDTYEPGHAEHALREVQAALPRLHADSLLIFDDSPWSGGRFTGKGAQAVPALLEQGWRVLYAGYQVVLHCDRGEGRT